MSYCPNTPWPTVILSQDFVNINTVPLSTNTQLYDASRVLTENSGKSYYFSVSTFTAKNTVRLPGPKFSCDQDRMLYKLGQNSYLGSQYK
jgi:hypothetical protein